MATYSANSGVTLLTGATDANGDAIRVRRINGSIIAAWPHTVSFTGGSVSITPLGVVTYDDAGVTADHPGSGSTATTGTFTFTLWDGQAESATYTCTVNLTGGLVVLPAIEFGALTLAGEGGFPATSFTADGTGHFTLTGGLIVPTSAGDTADLNAGPYSVTVDGVARTIVAIPKCWTVNGQTQYASRITMAGATGTDGPTNPLTDRILHVRPGAYTVVSSHYNNRYYGNATNSTYTNNALAFEIRGSDASNKPVFTMTGVGSSGGGRWDNLTNVIFRNIVLHSIYRPGTDVDTDAQIYNGATGTRWRNARFIGVDFTTNSRTIGICYPWRNGLFKPSGNQIGIGVGGLTISGCTFDGASQTLSIGLTEAVSHPILIEKTQIRGYAADGFSITSALLSGSTVDTTPLIIRDVLMTDPFNRDADVNFGSSASLTRATLTGAANTQRATFFCMVKVNVNDTFTGTVFAQGTDFRVRLVTAGTRLVNVVVDAVDTTGATVVNMTSSSTYSTRCGEYLGILVSLDTTGTHRLYVWSNKFGSVGWTSQASQLGGGETLRLSTGSATIGATNMSYRWMSYWQGVALDATSSTVRDYFVNAAHPTYLPIYTTSGDPHAITIPAGLVTATASATLLVEFGRTYGGWQAGTNTGTGGNFTVAGVIERDHGDGIQSGFGVTNMVATDFTFERVIMFEHATSCPYAPDRQFLFQDDVNIGEYKRVKVHGCAAYVATNYAQFLNNPTNCVTRSLTVVPNLHYWERVGSVPASTTPGMRVVRDTGSKTTGSWSIEDTFVPLIDTVDGSFSPSPITSTNRVNPYSTPPSVATWQTYVAANFAGPTYKPATWQEFVRFYQPKAGGALDLTTKVGGLNQYFTFDFVNGGSSNHPNGAP